MSNWVLEKVHCSITQLIFYIVWYLCGFFFYNSCNVLSSVGLQLNVKEMVVSSMSCQVLFFCFLKRWDELVTWFFKSSNYGKQQQIICCTLCTAKDVGILVWASDFLFLRNSSDDDLQSPLTTKLERFSGSRSVKQPIYKVMALDSQTFHFSQASLEYETSCSYVM